MRVTAANFAYFKHRCKHWIRRFSLNDYEFLFKQDAIGGNMAESHMDYRARTVVITLNTEWDGSATSPSKASIDSTAFHEVVESMFYHLEAQARQRDDAEDLETERHALVNRIWHAIKEKT